MSPAEAPPSGALSVRHLLGIEGLTRDDVNLLLDTARNLDDVNKRPLKKVPILRGRTVVTLFFENSTRTRLSFDVAAKRLSADTVSFSASSSSLSKGETLLDTTRNIEAYGPDVVVIRHGYAGAAHMVAGVTAGAVINAGDGVHEHPTQALLDAYTLLEKLGRSPAEGLDGLTIAIVGDIAHSRVAGSNLRLLPLLGAKVRVAGPKTMLPVGVEALCDHVTTDIDEAIEGADAVMMLRIQKERIAAPLMSSDREYNRRFGLTQARAERLAKDALILHPGPINRGVEIDPEVADSGRSIILDQARSGVAVRMACLYLLTLGRMSAGKASAEKGDA
jgi:aspartate carbamoyltransferase catalytic subunit